jgi:amidase
VKQLFEHTATELAALIAGGEASSREVVEAHLARIEQVNGAVNAITFVLADSALAAADAADAATAAHRTDAARRDDTAGRGLPRRPLHGVPFTVKENIDCLGSPTTQGVPLLRNAMPRRDAPVVARLRAAGAIVLARTNLPEFGLRLSTDNPLYGPTLNPWNPHLTPGGSSGGEAVALATGMTPLGLGNDLGGSLRNPAYCCGVAALKPTTGRIPRASSLPPLDFGAASQLMAVDGPLARSVADLRLALSLLAGRDIRDPRSVDAPLRGPEPATRRAALVTSLTEGEIPAETVVEIARAGRLLEAAGWQVEEAEPPELELVTQTWLDLIATDFAVMMPGLRAFVSGPVYDYIMDVCAQADLQSTSNSEIHATRSRLTRLWSEFFVRYPVCVGPTWTQLPWPVDADLAPATGMGLVRDTVRFITPGNVLGLPSVALPTGVVAGLPTGIQIYADLWREDLCLEAAEIVEAGVDAPTPIDPLR